MKLVVDVQGFKIENNKFIVKEFAAFNGSQVCHYVFKPPFPLRMLPSDLHKQATWLMNNHHAIDWNNGYTPLHHFGSIFQKLIKDIDCIYVKGMEKANYIKKFSTVPVYEIDEQPAFELGEPLCFYHKNNKCICALSNVYFLYNKYMMQN
ncbi:unnamed protein product [Psylliodes chrysocephalus]|uniref:Uncharacterized protein n=1 Tax=Psylliodes chrysocephalus TaxID=3402493 RepID=A0A9P0G7I9_9CUCU|nr:unnamed protein product [Psylliodes chrysocephala]